MLIKSCVLNKLPFNIHLPCPDMPNACPKFCFCVLFHLAGDYYANWVYSLLLFLNKGTSVRSCITFSDLKSVLTGLDHDRFSFGT